MGVQLDAYRKHLGGTKPLNFTSTIELDIIFDVLNGCEMKCPGCYVDRKNKFLPLYLEKIYRLTNQFKDQGIEANELFLGPTDIFATTNFEEVISEPLFDKLVEQYAAITFTSTMLTPHEDLKEKVDQLMNIMAPYGKRFELFVILDIEKYIKNDRSYLDQLDKNLELIANIDSRLKKQVNVFFIANFYPEMFSNVSIFDLNKMIKRDYGSKFKINPSFARASNQSFVELQCALLKNLLVHQVNNDTIKDVFLNMIDVHFGGETFYSLSYADDRLFIAPYFYEFIALKRDSLEIQSRADGFFYMEDVFTKQNELSIEQFTYSENLKSCSQCEFLPSCVSRGHIEFMKLNNITNCIVPKEIFRSSYKVENHYGY